MAADRSLPALIPLCKQGVVGSSPIVSTTKCRSQRFGAAPRVPERRPRRGDRTPGGSLRRSVGRNDVPSDPSPPASSSPGRADGSRFIAWPLVATDCGRPSKPAAVDGARTRPCHPTRRILAWSRTRTPGRHPAPGSNDKRPWPPRSDRGPCRCCLLRRRAPRRPLGMRPTHASPRCPSGVPEHPTRPAGSAVRPAILRCAQGPPSPTSSPIVHVGRCRGLGQRTASRTAHREAMQRRPNLSCCVACTPDSRNEFE